MKCPACGAEFEGESEAARQLYMLHLQEESVRLLLEFSARRPYGVVEDAPMPDDMPDEVAKAVAAFIADVRFGGP